VEEKRFTLSITIQRETRDIEFRTLACDKVQDRAWSTSSVAVCQRNGGKLWPCILRAYLRGDKWSVSMSDVRLNRQYPVVGWRDPANKIHESQHNGR
jgi:hypothetical protein